MKLFKTRRNRHKRIDKRHKEQTPRTAQESSRMSELDKKVNERKLRLRRLIDKWTASVVLLFSLLKILQLLKRIGFTARDNGWRIAMRAYLRAEHSKFCLAVFRLNVFSNTDKDQPTTYAEAREHCVRRLASFLKTKPTIHWQIDWGKYTAWKVRKQKIDIVEARFESDGTLGDIVPYLDHNDFTKVLNQKNRHRLNQIIINSYNAVRDISDKKRPWRLKRKIYETLVLRSNLPRYKYIFMLAYVERILSATFIRFELLSDQAHSSAPRFRSPRFIHFKHPGYGLCNLLCRMDPHFNEVDLWFQFNHIPVDGMPMQEVLHELKKDWGEAGPLVFPSAEKKDPILLERCSTMKGKKATYHAQDFVDFSRLLNIRKDLNELYAQDIGGSITVVSMLMWSLARLEIAQDAKFLFTVDIMSATEDSERRPGGVIIKPGKYINQDNPIKGFLEFQKEFIIRTHATRMRKGESYEMLELFSLLSPYTFRLAHYFIPNPLKEFTGSIAMTMIKNSDIFLTPMSDIHTEGFLAFGNLSVPTEDGKTAGFVSVRGSKDTVAQYLTAINAAAQNFYDVI